MIHALVVWSGVILFLGTLITAVLAGDPDYDVHEDTKE